jgi:hypothetical protein
LHPALYFDAVKARENPGRSEQEYKKTVLGTKFNYPVYHLA